MVSCARAYGCDGGSLTAPFTYGKTYAVSDDTVYPYTSASSGVTGTCNTALTNKGVFKVGTISTTATGSTIDLKCSNLLSRLSTNVQSIAIYVPDNIPDFYYYSTGIYNKCFNLTPNHAMSLIGNDESGNWLLVNSWGVGWG